ncbi:MAG TPA: hypothetical protein VKT77_07465 [Chthonomonadaceae bacterium]|nr:hypothetical protein [Chthonomonadaceae bacterium]
MDPYAPRSNRTRVLFALAGLLACLIGAAIAEPILAGTHAGQKLRQAHVASILYLTGPGTTTHTIQPPAPAISDDEIQRRLLAEGAQSGEVQVSLAWNNRNDLDLSCQEPSGEMIDGYNQESSSGGVLDIDMNPTGDNMMSEQAKILDAQRHGRRRDHRTANSDTAPVENLVWAHDAPIGHYKVFVHQFCNKERFDRTPYWVMINVRGKITRISGVTGREDFASDLIGPRLVYEFDVTPPQPVAATPVEKPKPPPPPPPPIIVKRTEYGLAGLGRALLACSLWGALIGLLPLALLLAQRLYLRLPALRGSEDLVVVFAGPATGAGAAVLGQLLLALAAAALPPGAMLTLFVICWTLLGAAFGCALSLFTPNVGRAAGPVAGACSALAGSLLFLLPALSAAHGGAGGHLLTPVLIGGAIGALIALPERERAPEPEPPPPAPPERRTHELAPPFIVHGTRTRKVGGLRKEGPPES